MVTTRSRRLALLLSFLVLCGSLALTGELARASSHCEAPTISRFPRAEPSDIYIYQSFDDVCSETDDFVHFLMNYQPLRLPGGLTAEAFAALVDIEIDRQKGLEGRWTRLFKDPDKPPTKEEVEDHCGRLLKADRTLRREPTIAERLALIERACGQVKAR